MRIAASLMLAAVSALAQTNPVATAQSQALSAAQRHETARMEAIQSRRIICGKILKILPDGIVVDSGYTNLMRTPLDQSWLIPGTATATRAAGIVEASQPDAVCVGLVFVTDLPKSRGAKPKLFDYIVLEGFPVGQYSYTSVGDLQRTVREFTTKLPNAARWNFVQGEQKNAPPK
jgi:hypothetical protein